MSSPTSMKMMPPIYIEPQIRRRNIGWYLLIVWISLLPLSCLFFWFFAPRFIHLIGILDYPVFQFRIEYLFGITDSSRFIPLWVFALLTPCIFIIGYFITIIWSAIITKVGIFCLNKRHAAKIGVFHRNIQDKDYRYWNYRNLVRLFFFWLMYSLPISWGKVSLSYRFFGNQFGKNLQILQAWIAPEFVSIGNNVTIGQAAGIYSFQFEGDKLLVAPVTIEDNVIIGPQAVILPGSEISSNITMEGMGFTFPFTKLKKSGIYEGQPYHWARNN